LEGSDVGCESDNDMFTWNYEDSPLSLKNEFAFLSWTRGIRDGLKKAHEKVSTDLERWSYWAFNTIELKIESVPYYTNKFSDYLHWYFSRISHFVCLSRIRLVSSILHHVCCAAQKKVKYVLEIIKWVYSVWYRSLLQIYKSFLS